MVAGLNMLSFDLFGLGRKTAETTSPEIQSRAGAEHQKRADDRVAQDQPEQKTFFWALAPVS